jgi:imidazoleglycerol-phosphate dehydratase/histidinol-phosphatase
MVWARHLYPEDTFYPVHNFILKTFENEGVHFTYEAIDRTWPADNAPTRKPATGLLTQYLDATKYDLANSFTIGDRKNDVLLAKNLGAKAIWLNNSSGLGDKEFAAGVIAISTGVVALANH